MQFAMIDVKSVFIFFFIFYLILQFRIDANTLSCRSLLSLP